MRKTLNLSLKTNLAKKVAISMVAVSTLLLTTQCAPVKHRWTMLEESTLQKIAVAKNCKNTYPNKPTFFLCGKEAKNPPQGNVQITKVHEGMKVYSFEQNDPKVTAWNWAANGGTVIYGRQGTLSKNDTYLQLQGSFDCDGQDLEQRKVVVYQCRSD